MRLHPLVSSVVVILLSTFLAPPVRADFVAVTGDGNVYRIDPATGVATLLGRRATCC